MQNSGVAGAAVELQLGVAEVEEAALALATCAWLQTCSFGLWSPITAVV